MSDQRASPRRLPPRTILAACALVVAILGAWYWATMEEQDAFTVPGLPAPNLLLYDEVLHRNGLLLALLGTLWFAPPLLRRAALAVGAVGLLLEGYPTFVEALPGVAAGDPIWRWQAASGGLELAFVGFAGFLLLTGRHEPR